MAKLRRAGFSLVELLIVVAIALLLVAVTLPQVKYQIEENKIREASRQVHAFFAEAKAEAAFSKRPTGVWLAVEDTGGGLPKVSKMSLAQIPPPYSGDTPEARVSFIDVSAQGGFPIPLQAGQKRWELVFRAPVGTIAVPPPYPATNTPPVSAQSMYSQTDPLVANGESFSIQLEYKDRLYLCRRDDISGNFRFTTITYNDPPTGSSIGYTFQIFRQPGVLGKPRELPKGTCIDTMFSGMGNGGIEFQNATQRVLVMFGPSGAVTQVYIDGVAIDAQGTCHFLVGRPEKLQFATDLPAALPQSNLFEGSNVWVSINRRTGGVVSSDLLPSSLPYGTAAQQQQLLIDTRTNSILRKQKGGL